MKVIISWLKSTDKDIVEQDTIDLFPEGTNHVMLLGTSLYVYHDDHLLETIPTDLPSKEELVSVEVFSQD
jgi:hypothetical protein